MKAVVLRSYGSADQLEFADADKPVPAHDEVLVRVRATSVNPYDWHHMRGEPVFARAIAPTMGLRVPKLTILGCDMAGEVEEAGRSVTRFRPGDRVFALLPGGGYAEYVAVKEDLLATMPENLSYEEAAATPMAAVTALLALRDLSRLTADQQVLVNGASGGVGTFAVQVAKALGASVTAVCGARHADLIRSLGADRVIDYRAQDFTREGQRYDVLLDIAGSRPVTACRRVVAPKGTIVIIGGPAGRWLKPMGRALGSLAAGPMLGRRVVMADAVGRKQKAQDLKALTELIELIEDGKVKPVIDRTYSFDQIPAAVAYQEQGHAQGKVVVTV
jgi:NADPH:quinone reductase-like Zn-dependent oxidoreductase